MTNILEFSDHAVTLETAPLYNSERRIQGNLAYVSIFSDTDTLLLKANAWGGIVNKIEYTIDFHFLQDAVKSEVIEMLTSEIKALGFENKAVKFEADLSPLFNDNVSNLAVIFAMQDRGLDFPLYLENVWIANGEYVKIDSAYLATIVSDEATKDCQTNSGITRLENIEPANKRPANVLPLLLEYLRGNSDYLPIKADIYETAKENVLKTLGLI